MKQLSLFITFILTTLFISCDSDIEKSNSNNSTMTFTQIVTEGEDIVVGGGPNYVIMATWSGSGIETIDYNCFEYNQSKDISNDDIAESLTRHLDKSSVNDINNGDTTVFDYFVIEPEIVYEVISMAIDSIGYSIICRDTVSLKEVVYENNFHQALRLSDRSYDDIKGNNIIVATYYGKNIKNIISGMFLWNKSTMISDKDIINELTYEFNMEELILTNNPEIAAGCHKYYPDLEFNTTYEIVTFATFYDNTTQLCRDTIKTGLSPED